MSLNGNHQNGNGAKPHGLPVYPQLQFNDRDYAELKGHLHLFSDHIVMEQINNGQPENIYIVDPLDLASRLINLGVSSGPLPRNTLFWSRKDGKDKIAVFAEPHVWGVSVDGQKNTWFVAMPPLVWVGHDQKYGLWAVKNDVAWPTGATPLYQAPCPNVSNQGICQGTVSFPVAASATIWPALELFFQSGFNNHLANGKSAAAPKNILNMWGTLFREGRQTYPDDDLVPANLTLQEIVE